MDDAMRHRLDVAVERLTTHESDLEQHFQRVQREQAARHAALNERFRKLAIHLQPFVDKLTSAGHEARISGLPGKPFVDPGPRTDPNERELKAAEWVGPSVTLAVRVAAIDEPHLTFTGTLQGVRIARALRSGVTEAIADLSDHNFTDEAADKAVVEFIEALAAGR